MRQTPCLASAMLFSFLFACLLAPFVSAQIDGTYFVIAEPSNGKQWANGATNPVQWTKGLLDGVSSFDIELARSNKDGILYLARDVPATTNSFNVYLNNVPSADDYYMIFINSTHGVMYAVSPQFAIVDSTAASNGSMATPVAGAPTVTLSGAPNPTAAWATTYPPTNDGIPSNWTGMGGWMSNLMTILGGAFAGAALLFAA